MSQTTTEAVHPASAGLHAAAGAEVLRRLWSAQCDALAALPPAFPQIEAAAEAAAHTLRGGGKLAYAGAGSSGLMALSDALELAGTFGIPPDRTPVLFAGGAAALLHMVGSVEDDPALAAQDVQTAGLAEGDAVVCVSASGRTAYTLAVARLAAERGSTVIGIASVPGSVLLEMADIAILLETGPEVIGGSTRLGAATAQKVALNLMSVRIGILLGHVHDGFMVNLVADNGKLRDRAARIVAAVAGAAPDRARAALEATQGAVKPAILVARGLAPPQADQALARTGGHLAPLLD